MKLWKEKPLLRSTDNYIPAVNTARYLEGQKRILLVGDAGGRERQYLNRFGKELYVLDIAPQDHTPNLIVQSIEKRTPFEDEFFDGVVMNEVLEHLFWDLAALEEVYRVMKNNGVLVVSVPYMSNIQDAPEHHVRIHSPRTMRRLLERAGFVIEEHFCRGFCSRLIQLNPLIRTLIYLSHKAVEVVTRRSPDEAVDIVNGVLERLERFLGTHALTIRFQRKFASYGGMMRARKVSEKKNFDEIQIATFKNRA